MATTKISANVLASGAALTNINAGSTIDFTKNTSISGNLTVDTNTFFVDAVNNRIGIGTITPATTLDIVGSATISANLIVDINALVVDATNNRVGIGTLTPSTALHVIGAITASGNLIVDTNTLFVDSSTDRVGIGTATPSYKLDVNGDMSAGAIYTTDASTTRSNLGLDMQVKVKAATDSVTSSTTFISDSELRNFNVVANASYRVDFNLFAAIGAGGIKLQLLTTSNQSPNGAILGTISFGSVGPSNITSVSTSIIDLRLRSTAAAAVVPICGYFYFSCTANDTVSLQFAQNASNAAATELRPNSCVRITKIS